MPHSQAGSGAWHEVGPKGQPLEPLRRRRWGNACERDGRKIVPIAAVAAEISGPRWFHRERVIDDSVADDSGADDDDIDGINITEVADSSSMKDSASTAFAAYARAARPLATTVST